MHRKRAVFQVAIDLDPIPGAHHIPAEVHGWLQGLLDSRVEHYDPAVTLLGVQD